MESVLVFSQSSHHICSYRAMLYLYSVIVVGVCVLYLWATDSGPRLHSKLA